MCFHKIWSRICDKKYLSYNILQQYLLWNKKYNCCIVNEEVDVGVILNGSVLQRSGVFSGSNTLFFLNMWNVSGFLHVTWRCWGNSPFFSYLHATTHCPWWKICYTCHCWFLVGMMFVCLSFKFHELRRK